MRTISGRIPDEPSSLLCHLTRLAVVCVVRLVDPADVMRKLVYTATNPVKDHLVERVHYWRDINGLAMLLGRRRLCATRSAFLSPRRCHA
jgi:hypothetical protein